MYHRSAFFGTSHTRVFVFPWLRPFPCYIIVQSKQTFSKNLIHFIQRRLKFILCVYLWQPLELIDLRQGSSFRISHTHTHTHSAKSVGRRLVAASARARTHTENVWKIEGKTNSQQQQHSKQADWFSSFIIEHNRGGKRRISYVKCQVRVKIRRARAPTAPRLVYMESERVSCMVWTRQRNFARTGCLRPEINYFSTRAPDTCEIIKGETSEPKEFFFFFGKVYAGVLYVDRSACCAIK